MDWENLAKAYKNHQTCTDKIFLTKYLHGWLPTGVRRKKLILQGNDNCPMCGNRETNEQIIECQSPKNRYKRETRLSAMSSRAQQVHVRKCVSSAWLQYIKQILLQRKEKFKTNFDPGTSETMKGRILKAIEQQNKLGLILTLRGYFGKVRKSAVYHHSEEDRQTTEAQRNSWATSAIHQFWKVIIGACMER